MLYDSKIFRVTDELYDTEVYQKEGDSPFPWVIVFTKDRFNKEFNHAWNQLNQVLFQSMWELKDQHGEAINVGFVDIYDGGELVKMTYDLQMVPSVRMVRGQNVYHMNWNDKSRHFY